MYTTEFDARLHANKILHISRPTSMLIHVIYSEHEVTNDFLRHTTLQTILHT